MVQKLDSAICWFIIAAGALFPTAAALGVNEYLQLTGRSWESWSREGWAVWFLLYGLVFALPYVILAMLARAVLVDHYLLMRLTHSEKRASILAGFVGTTFGMVKLFYDFASSPSEGMSYFLGGALLFPIFNIGYSLLGIIGGLVLVIGTRGIRRLRHGFHNP
jgi:hypothetical protein